MEAATQPAAVLESFNPATGERIGSVPVTDPAQVQGVVDAVADVQPFWAQLTLPDRARYMRRAAQVIIDHLDELTALLTREHGRPRGESYSMELVPSIDALHWIAENGPKILAGEKVKYSQPYFPQRRSHLQYEPLGVVGVVSPWDRPWAVPFGDVAMALMAGNGAVLKSASLAPLVGRRIQDVFERAGLPDGIVRSIHGGADTEQALAGSTVAKTFLSGTEGKDPQLVLADAGIRHAVEACAWAGFTGSGIERVYVLPGVAEPFTNGLVDAARRLAVGDPMEWSTDIGPIASEQHFEHVKALVDAAVEAGATMHCGGPTGERTFFAPTVLTGVTPEMRIMREQIRGPVVPIMAVGTEEEAIRQANGAEPSAGASVWTPDRGKGERIARRLEARSVWINDHLGLRGSHSRFGLYECVNVKHVTWDPSRTANFWWHPYDEALGTALHSAAQLLYGRDEDKRAALQKGAAPLARLGRKMLGR
jgi:succinate-semialdehyde dehydrogenase/glutarate-semialdehyde dehydrogenase